MAGYFEIIVPTTGADGAAEGALTTSSPAFGTLHAVSIEYDGDAPGTTNVTLKEVGGLERTLLTVAANNTDGLYHPTVALSSNAGVASSDGAIQPALYDVKLLVEVTDSDALTEAVVVRILVI